ncbi:putative repair and recombination protein [Acinetobacter phage SH-Ab 15599]|nr:putative repair and recombination protein [Acinetobacter phage SH-Ab 15599]
MSTEKTPLQTAREATSQRIAENEARFEQIQKEIEEVLEVNSEMLDSEALRHVKIHTMIQRHYTREYKALEKQIIRFDLAKNKAKKYYLGKSSEEEYAQKPLRVSVMKTEVDEYMKVDEDLILAKMELQVQERIVKYLEDSKKMMSERLYAIKYAIDFKRMMSGT